MEGVVQFGQPFADLSNAQLFEHVRAQLSVAPRQFPIEYFLELAGELKSRALFATEDYVLRLSAERASAINRGFPWPD